MARTKTSPTRLPPEDQLQQFLLKPTGPLSWPEVFGNDHPVEVEVGCGKGLFLVSAAGSFPKRNFFGIEIAHKFARFTAARLANQALTNARVAQADARRVLTMWIADASVETVHVYFPDPWWKRRHKKRRIFTDSFLTQVVRVLVPGGQLRLATDVRDYFDEIRSLIGWVAGVESSSPQSFGSNETARGSKTRPQPPVASQPALTPAELPADHSPQNELDYLTNFERKYRKVGKPVFRACYTKE